MRRHSVCETVIFRLGTEIFGFEAYHFLDYRSTVPKYRQVSGAVVPPCYLGYTTWSDGRPVFVQDLRVRFGFPIRPTPELIHETIVFQDSAGKLYGFVVDEVLEFCSTRNERPTPWGIDAMLVSVPYRSIVEGWVTATIDRRSVSLWMLRLGDLFLPELKTAA